MLLRKMTSFDDEPLRDLSPLEPAGRLRENPSLITLKILSPGPSGPAGKNVLVKQFYALAACHLTSSDMSPAGSCGAPIAAGAKLLGAKLPQMIFAKDLKD
jgi:hypothetical protein